MDTWRVPWRVWRDNTLDRGTVDEDGAMVSSNNVGNSPRRGDFFPREGRRPSHPPCLTTCPPYLCCLALLRTTILHVVVYHTTSLNPERNTSPKPRCRRTSRLAHPAQDIYERLLTQVYYYDMRLPGSCSRKELNRSNMVELTSATAPGGWLYCRDYVSVG